MKREILKLRSGFYYYILFLLSMASALFFSRCHNPGISNRQKHSDDSLTSSKRDSLHADSIKKGLFPTYYPVKYGVPVDPRATEYGIPPSDYKLMDTTKK
ncbi:MAG: hypothetical protein V2A54_07735 [Bacteroidota bacterium]